MEEHYTEKRYLPSRRINLIGQNRVEYYKQRIYEELAIRRSDYKRSLSEIHKRSDWVNYRDYKSYNNFYKLVLGRNIVDHIIGLHKGESTPVKILELGAGKGVFLSGLKALVRKHPEGSGLKIETTAVSLDREDELQKRVDKKEIDKVLYGHAEEINLGDKYDLIFDTYGANYYTPTYTKSDMLKLSLLHLSDSGTMLVMYEERDLLDAFKGLNISALNSVLKRRDFFQFKYYFANLVFNVKIAYYNNIPYEGGYVIMVNRALIS